MNLRTVAIVIFCAALLALASQPLGKLYVESHIEALTSSRLSLNKFRVHPISGRTSVGDSQWIATKLAFLQHWLRSIFRLPFQLHMLGAK